MNNILNVECKNFYLDDVDFRDVQINLDEYVFFEIDYRGKDSWHIKGHKYNIEHNWIEEELTENQVSTIYDVAKFIAEANAYSSGKFQPCKISRFSNLHYTDSFYDDLKDLLELVKKLETTKLNKYEII